MNTILKRSCYNKVHSVGIDMNTILLNVINLLGKRFKFVPCSKHDGWDAVQH